MQMEGRVAGVWLPRDSIWHITNPSFFCPKHSIPTLISAHRELGTSLLTHTGTESPLPCPVWQEPWTGTGQARQGHSESPACRWSHGQRIQSIFHTSLMAVMLLADLVMMYWPGLLSGKKKNGVGKMFLYL